MKITNILLLYVQFSYSFYTNAILKKAGFTAAISIAE